MVNCTTTKNSNLQSNILKVLLFRKLCIAIDNYFKHLAIPPLKININVQYQCPEHMINIIISYDAVEYAHIQCVVNFNDPRNIHSWKNINNLVDMRNIIKGNTNINRQNGNISVEQILGEKQTGNYNHLNTSNNRYNPIGDPNYATFSGNIVVFNEDISHLKNISRIFSNNHIHQFVIKLILKDCFVFERRSCSSISLYPVKCTRIWRKNLIRVTKILDKNKDIQNIKLCNYNILRVNMNMNSSNNNRTINSQTRNPVISQRNNNNFCNSNINEDNERNKENHNRRKRMA